MPQQYFNKEKIRILSSFFNSIAVAWFVAAFITPGLLHDFNILTILLYVVMMGLSLGVSIILAPKE